MMITSVSNQRAKHIVQLNKKSGERKKEGIFIAEGTKMFLEAPPENICEVYVSTSYLHSLRGETAQPVNEKLSACSYEEVSDEVFLKISDTQTPQGILCLIQQKQYSLEKMLQDKDDALLLILEGLQDPGNLGTIVRTGEGAGVTGIILSRDVVDLYNPKTIRATMGSVYRVPCTYTEDLVPTIKQVKEAGISVYAAHLQGAANYDACDYRKGTAFLVGNEGNGLNDSTAEAADSFIKIPMKGQVESLNAAVASSLLLYEAARQRNIGLEQLVSVAVSR